MSGCSSPSGTPNPLELRLVSLLALLLIAAPGWADDSAKLAALFAPAFDRGGVVVIPPGDDVLDGGKPLAIPSRTVISALGARFHLPKTLGDKTRVVLFAGENVRDFRWFGGHFAGQVFDPAPAGNSWKPNANTRAILITTTPGGRGMLANNETTA